MTTLYKFLRNGLKSQHGNFQWEIGKWYKHDGEISACYSGFHASDRAIDALSYVPGEIIALVEVKGDSAKQSDKQVWSEMRVVKAWHWTKEDSVALAIFAAEQVIDIFEAKYPNDDRPRKAIDAAKAYLKDPAARTARTAAYAAYAATRAAYAAARAAYAADAADAARAADAADAARAADAAARAADAARAAYAAARAARAAYAADAAYAAYAATRAADAAVLDKCNDFILARLTDLREIN